MWYRYTLAADGGLIYAMYETEALRCHIACNPVSKDLHHIMAPEHHWSYHRESVVMSVDNTTQSYKILTMEPYVNARTARRDRFYMYDSTTEHWRKLCEVPDDDHYAYSCIFLKGTFYTLFVDTSAVPWCLMLYSCDFETGAWRHIDVELNQPSCPQDKSQLVVSLGRLFIVEYTGLPILVPPDRMTTWETLLANNRVKKKQLNKVRVSEILLAKKEVKEVADMPTYSMYPRRMLYKNRQNTVLGDEVVAVGCGDSIVFSSSFGRRLGFDLMRNCWHELPANSTSHGNDTTWGSLGFRGSYVGHVDLDLRKMRR